MLSLPPFLFAAALLTISSPAEVESFAPSPGASLSKLLPRSQSSSSPSLTSNGVALDSHAADSLNDEIVGPSSTSSSTSEQRRKILQSALIAPLAISQSLVLPQSASAASEKPPPILPLLTTAKRLHVVPTFTIVDGTGVPFHTYDKDSAGGFGYFFTSYTSAEYVLDDAKKAFAKAKTEAAAKKQDSTENNNASAAAGEGVIGEDGTGDVPDAWGQAQIVTVPLDAVMQLSVKKTSSIAQNGKGKKFSTFYQVIPSTEDLNAALRIENGPRYSERGRVPLFYVDGLTLPGGGEDGGVLNPVYFRIKDLKAEWQKQYPGIDLPTIKVRELNETFRSMIRPGGKDTSVKNMVFVPIPESVEKAKGSGRSYKLGEMILTK